MDSASFFTQIASFSAGAILNLVEGKIAGRNQSLAKSCKTWVLNLVKLWTAITLWLWIGKPLKGSKLSIITSGFANSCSYLRLKLSESYRTLHTSLVSFISVCSPQRVWMYIHACKQPQSTESVHFINKEYSHLILKLKCSVDLLSRLHILSSSLDYLLLIIAFAEQPKS